MIGVCVVPMLKWAGAGFSDTGVPNLGAKVPLIVKIYYGVWCFPFYGRAPVMLTRVISTGVVEYPTVFSSKCSLVGLRDSDIFELMGRTDLVISSSGGF